MVKVVVAVDEDKEVESGLEEGFIIHRCSIYDCCSTRTEIWWWWKKMEVDNEVAGGLDVLGW